jgi:hypothetical protein
MGRSTARNLSKRRRKQKVAKTLRRQRKLEKKMRSK